ncbi:uncharacterized protein LOC144157946 [Haemaphysalis longicornis]
MLEPCTDKVAFLSLASLLVRLNWAIAQDVNFHGSIIHTLRERYRDLKEELVSVYFDNDPNDAWPDEIPGVKVRWKKVPTREMSVSVETTSVTALDQWYHNGQKNNSLEVKLIRKTQRTTTVTSQVLRGIRATGRLDVSVQLPKLGDSGPGVAVKAALGTSYTVDTNERVTETVKKTDTFNLNQVVIVPPLTSTHVTWVIAEERMLISWNATLYLEGNLMIWSRRNGQWVKRFRPVCELADPKHNELRKTTNNTCTLNVRGITQVEGGFASQITTKNEPLKIVKTLYSEN